MPTPPFDDVSLAAPVMPAAPRSWMPTTRPASRISRQASISRFSSNGSPTCTLGRLSSSPSSPKPADASTLAPPMPSRPVDEPNSTARLPTPDARASTRRSVGSDAEAEHVDERVVLIGGIEHGLTTDGGHADGVAISGNPGHDAFGDPPAAGVVQRAEPQRVHERDRAGPDGEDIAEDAADAGGGALVGLDGRRVVVALDAEGGRDAVADVDDPGALARARRARAAPRWAGGAGGSGTTCRSSAPTTSPRTWPARGGWAAARGSRAMAAASSSVSPRARWSGASAAGAARRAIGAAYAAASGGPDTAK